MKRPDWDNIIVHVPRFPLIGIPVLFALVVWYAALDCAYWSDVGRRKLAHAMGWHTYAWWHNVAANSIWRCRKCGRLQFRKHKFYGTEETT